MHVTTYNGWELGHHRPHLTTLAMLCNAFDAAPEVIGFIDQVPEEQVSPKPALPVSPLVFAKYVTQEDEPMLYDMLEVRIISYIVGWRLQNEAYEVLQGIIQQEIRRFDNMQRPEQNKDVQISRRQALNVIAKLPIGLFGLTTLGDVKNIPHEEVLSACAAGLIACKALYNSGEVKTVETTLTTYLSTLTNLANYSSHYQKQAAGLVAQTYLLMTLIADHRRDYSKMECYCLEAQKYAQLAEDVNLEVAALLRLAVKFDYESRWRKTLQTYQSVTPFLPRISLLLQTRLYLGLAGAYAYCHEKENARKTLAIAQKMFPAQPEKDSYFLSAFTNTHTLSLWTGLVQKHTNQYDEALDTFSVIGRLQPKQDVPECNRIEYVNYVASIAIRQQDLERSCTYVENAGSTALAIGHEQRYVETCDTYKEMQLVWGREPKVLALQELFSQR